MDSIDSKNLKKVRKNILNKDLLFEKFEHTDYKNKSFNILLVDDDLTATEIFLLGAAYLNIFDNIVTEQNSPVAMEYLKTLKIENKPFPEIIFLDINMPIMSGYQFLDEYNKIFDDEKTLIIFFSSYSPDSSDAIKQKNVAYIEKPFCLNDFLEILKEKGL